MYNFDYVDKNLVKSCKKELINIIHQVQDEVKKYRAQNLKELISKKQNEFLNSLIGTCQNVLIEHAKTDTNLYKGIASNYVKFIVEADKNISNNIVNVRGIEVRDKKIFAKFNNWKDLMLLKDIYC